MSSDALRIRLVPTAVRHHVVDVQPRNGGTGGRVTESSASLIAVQRLCEVAGLLVVLGDEGGGYVSMQNGWMGANANESKLLVDVKGRLALALNMSCSDISTVIRGESGCSASISAVQLP